MSREIVILWLVALPVIGGLAVAWHRVRQRRLPGRQERSALAAIRAAMAGWLPDPPAAAAAGSGRGTAVVGLLLGGLLLVWMGQAAYRQVPWTASAGVLTLMGLGLLAFFAAGRIMGGRPWPPRATAGAQRLAYRLRLNPGQLLLLLLALALALLATLAAGTQLLAHHALVAVTAWLAAVAFVVAGSLDPAERLRWRLSWREIGVTAVLAALALGLRATALDGIPPTLSGDEGSAGLTAVQFLDGRINNPFAFGWFSFPSFYFAVQSVGIWLWGQTAAALRLTSALAGAATVVAVYWLGRTMFDRATGFWAAAYLAASHYHVHMSRIGLNNIWDGLFASVALLGLWHGWRSGRRSSFILAGLALGLGPYFYVTIRVLPLLLLIWVVVARRWAPDTWRRRVGDLGLMVIVALVVALPLALLFVRFPADFNAPLQRVSVFNGWLASEQAATGYSAARILLTQMGTAALGFTHAPLRLLYDPGSPLLLAPAAALFLLGVAWSVRFLDLRTLLLFLPLLAAVVSGGLSVEPPGSQRYIMSMPMVALLLALPLGQAAGWLTTLWSRRRRLVLLGLSLVMGVVMLLDVRYYFLEVYDHYVLGGWNTETATGIAHYLQAHPIQGQRVYFFGPPRMGYHSLSTIPYLAPSMQGEDVAAPLAQPPSWSLTGPTLFIFLPERAGELAQVRASYPVGVYREFWTAARQPLFTAYEVVP